jgi:tetratricopeptide (TPR) repeat protein
LLHDQGKRDEAEVLLRRALAYFKRTLGEEDPKTLTCMNNLASVVIDASEEEELNRRAFEGRKKVLGSLHPQTLRSMYNLAASLWSLGRGAESENFSRQSMEGFEKVSGFGPDHPDTWVAVRNLARALSLQGKYNESAEMYHKAIKGFKRIPFMEKSVGLPVMHELAVLFQQHKDYAQSETVWRELAERSEEILGKNHPQTITGTGNLAMVLYRQDSFSEAEALWREVVARLEEVHGTENHESLTYMSNLATVLNDLGQFSNAEPMARKPSQAERSSSVWRILERYARCVL